MTDVTRAELDACARLLGGRYEPMDDNRGILVTRDGDLDVYAPWNPERDATDREALAREAKLIVNYSVQAVEWGAGLNVRYLLWPADGAESDCIIKAAAAVQIEREKQQ